MFCFWGVLFYIEFEEKYMEIGERERDRVSFIFGDAREKYIES